MTTMFEAEKKCGCCGKTVSVTQIGSTNAFGSSDLDARPPEMQRSAMFYFIERCENCGYVAWNLEETIPQSEALQRILSEPIDFSDYVQIFERGASIAELKGCTKDEVNWLHLNAAWSADDEQDLRMAVEIRKKILNNTNLDAISRPEDLLRLLDIARRAKEWEYAGQVLERLNKFELSPLLKKIAAFQQKLLNKHDTNCYKVEDVKD